MWTKIFTIGRVTSAGVLKWMAKNYYILILMAVIIPKIIGSFQTAIETHNFLHPFLQLGLNIINSDSAIADTVQAIAKDPVAVIGMVKPNIGVWNHIVYGWFFFKNIIWSLLGNIWMVTIPFVFLYKVIFNPIDNSRKVRALGRTFLWGSLFILFVNMSLVIYRLVEGTAQYLFTESMTIFQKTGAIMIYNLPFHGLFSLIKFLITGTP